MKPHDAIRLRQIEQFEATGDSMDFHNLILLSGMERDRDLRFCDWSDISFAGQNLMVDRGQPQFDFTGSLLKRSDFHGATIRGARFDQAVLGHVGESFDTQTDLVWAKDWLAHCDEWSRADHLASDRHIDELECFQDAPFAPKLTMLPTGFASASDLWGRPVRLSYRVAVASLPVTALQLIPYYRRLSRVGTPPPFLADRMERWYAALRSDEGIAKLCQEVVPMNWSESEQYLKWLREETGRKYQCIAEPVGEFAAFHGVITPTQGPWFEWTRDLWLDKLADEESDGSANLDGDSNLRVGRTYRPRDDDETGRPPTIDERDFLDTRRSDHRGKVRVQRAWVAW